MQRRTKRGFTMLEVMVVIGIVAIGAAIAMATFQRSTAKADMRSAANAMVGDFRRARSMAKTGTTPPGAFAAGQRTVQAGIRIVSATSYSVFVDNDNVSNGSEVAVEVVDMLTKYGAGFSITAPAVGTEIRFRRNGTLDQPNNINIVMTDTHGGGQRTITVTYGGSASFM
ncbi:MAG: type II secretion system protein [Deltaproteobacteria bacterium]